MEFCNWHSSSFSLLLLIYQLWGSFKGKALGGGEEAIVNVSDISDISKGKLLSVQERFEF
jgi:hypothetical protein